MRIVVVGASAAGISAITALRRLDKKVEIVLVSKDVNIYSRCILHHYVKGVRTIEKLSFVNPNFINNMDVIWKKGLSVMKVDPKRKEITLSNGEIVGYDRLLLATGASTFYPPIPGLKEARNAIGFHDFEDCVEIMKYARDGKHMVIMGAGLIGIDAVSGFLNEGIDISIVEMQDRMLSIQLDKRAASTYEEEFRKRGVKQYYGVGVKEIVCNEDKIIEKVILSDGTELPCDVLVVAAGVRANVSYLEGSGIETDRFGLVIDTRGKTNDDNIYGAGDITGRDQIWSVAVKEGMIAAANMMGCEREKKDFFGKRSTMNFLGIPTMSLGINEPPDDTYEVLIDGEETGEYYRKVIHKDGVIYGVIMQGDLSYGGVLTQMIRLGEDVSWIKKPLYEIDYSDFFHLADDLQYIYE